MKKFMLFALVAMVFAACDKKEEAYVFKPTEMIYLNGVERPMFKSTTTQYTLEEIVRSEELHLMAVTEFGNSYWSFNLPERRDTINNRLLLYSTDILTEQGELIYDFLTATDMHLVISLRGNYVGDTCGYIPQSVIDSAREQIETLYAQERYDEIYELFHSAFTFYTCTGEEYKQIMAGGGN